MTLEEFEAVVGEALDDMPSVIARHLEDVLVVVEERPTRAQLRDAGIKDPLGLYGLYEGSPLTDRSVFESGTLPDRITIFREPLQADFRGRDALRREIRKTVAHEVAHRFGLDEDRLRELGLD